MHVFPHPAILLRLQHFDQFLKQHPLAVFESSNLSRKDQYWRSLTLKSNEQDELMMSAVLHPQSLSKVLWNPSGLNSFRF